MALYWGYDECLCLCYIHLCLGSRSPFKLEARTINSAASFQCTEVVPQDVMVDADALSVWPD